MAVLGSFSMALNSVPLNSGTFSFFTGVFDSGESSPRRFLPILICVYTEKDRLKVFFSFPCHTSSVSVPRWSVNRKLSNENCHPVGNMCSRTSVPHCLPPAVSFRVIKLLISTLSLQVINCQKYTHLWSLYFPPTAIFLYKPGIY